MNSSQETESVVVKAHSKVKLAEELREKGQYSQAIEFYQQAAELFLHATNLTSDIDSIKALRLLSTSQANSANELLRQMRVYGVSSGSPPNKNSSAALNINRLTPVEPGTQLLSKTPPKSTGSSGNSGNSNTTGNVSLTTNSSGNVGNTDSLTGQLKVVPSSFPLESSSNSTQLTLSAAKSTTTIPHTVTTSPSLNSSFSNSTMLEGDSVFKSVELSIPSLHNPYASANQTTNPEEIVPNSNNSYNLATAGSPLVDLWHWVEKTLEEILLKNIPSTASGSSNSSNIIRSNSGAELSANSSLESSSLLSSFYIVSSPPQSSISSKDYNFISEYPSPMFTNTIAQNINQSSNESQIEQLQHQVKQLSELIARLRTENATLLNLWEQRNQVSQENNLLKKSIAQFKQEFRKKANEFKDYGVSNSVGDLNSTSQFFSKETEHSELGISTLSSSSTSSFPRQSQTLGTQSVSTLPDSLRLQKLEAEVALLSKELKLVNEKCAQKDKLIEKYEKKWEELKEEARKRRQTKSQRVDSANSSVMDSYSSIDIKEIPVKDSESVSLQPAIS